MQEALGLEELTAIHRLACGAAAGIVAMSATYPLEMVRGRLTILNEAMGAQSPYRGIVHAAMEIVRTEGMLALYKGWLPSVIGVIPYVGLNFAVYESLKKELVRSYSLKSEGELSIGVRLGCGALAGSVGQTIAYPLDVVRRRLQVTGWEAGREAMASLASGGGAGAVPATATATAGAGLGAYNCAGPVTSAAAATPSGAAAAGGGGGRVVMYTSMVDCFQKVVAEEGMGALFRGIWYALSPKVPAA